MSAAGKPDVAVGGVRPTSPGGRRWTRAASAAAAAAATPPSPSSMASRKRVASPSPFQPQVGAAANSVARRTRSRYRDAPAADASLSGLASTSPVSFVRLDDSSDSEPDDPTTTGEPSSSFRGQRRRGRPKGRGELSALAQGDRTVSHSCPAGHVSSPTAHPQVGWGGCVAKRTRSRFSKALPRSSSPSSATVLIDLSDSDEDSGGFESLGAQEEGNADPSMSVNGSAGGAVDVSSDSVSVDDGHQLRERESNCQDDSLEPELDNAMQGACHDGPGQGENASMPRMQGEGRYNNTVDEPGAGRSLDISRSCEQMEVEFSRSNANNWDMCEDVTVLAAASMSEEVGKKEGRSSEAVADSNSVEENLENKASLGTSGARQPMSERRGSNTNTGNMSEGVSFAAASLSGGSEKKEESSIAPAVSAAASTSTTKRKEENFTPDNKISEDNSSHLPPLVSDNGAPYEADASALASSSSADNIGKPVPQATNCIANRTRSRLWGEKLRPVDYTKFFKKTVELEEEEDSYLLVSSSSLSSSMSGTLDTEDSCSDDDMRQRKEVNPWWAEEEFDLGEDNNEEYIILGNRRWDGCQDRVFRERKGDGAKQDRNGSCFPAVKKRRMVDNDDTVTSFHQHKNAYIRDPAGKEGVHFKRQRSRSGVKRKRRRLVQIESLNTCGTHVYVSDEDESSVPVSVSSSFSDSEDVSRMHPKVAKKKSKYDEEEDNVQQPRKARKPKRNRPLIDEQLLKTLIDTISKGDPLEEGGFLDKEPCLPTSNSGMTGNTLPPIFSFNDDDGSEPQEKTEYEKEMDMLWDEYNFCLRSTDMCSYDTEMDEERQSEKMHSSVPCTQENHSFILDEEFGIVCKFCSAVFLEMRNMLPKFAINSSIYSKGLYCGGEDIPKLDQLCVQEMSKGPTDISYCSTGTVWDLIPGVKDTMYPHQQKGFEFMWRTLAGDTSLDKINRSNPDTIGGCMISHAPGTGKTRLSIMFLQSYMAAYPNCRPVILAPRGMLTVWEKEFVKWKVNIPFHILNRDDSASANLPLVGSKCKSVLQMRWMKLYDWITRKGVLGVSYGLFERIVSKASKKSPENAQISKLLIDWPDLLIFDEGHTPRNETSKIWKVLEKVKAERRIILSGTPFQNNFDELYNTLCLVRPKFAENITVKSPNLRSEDSKVFPKLEAKKSKRNVGRGKWAKLTSSIHNDETIEELRSMIHRFVHVHTGSILKSLPGLRECLIVLKLHPQQKDIIDLIESCNSENKATFAYWYKLSLATIHPALYVVSKLSEEEKAGINEKNLIGKRLNPNEGVKTQFVIELVRLSNSLKEKVLIFSQYLEPLSLMKDQLVSLFNWTEGREILQMNGNHCMRQRQLLIDNFNEPTSEVRVFLASTKACCEGISLTGASRVVLLDVVWNPSVENQAISRAFRIGQERVVYTYHLIAYDTMETVKYERQLQKEHISKRVFSSADCHKGMQQNISDLCEDKILDEIKGHEKLEGMIKRVVYQPKVSSLLRQ